MKAKPSLIRQGDVLLMKVAALPKDAVERPNDTHRVVLAYGEVTGHAHAIYEDKTSPVATKAKLWDAGAERYLQVLTQCKLQHEEHTAYVLEEGIYKQIFQVEEQQEIRNVAD